MSFNNSESLPSNQEMTTYEITYLNLNTELIKYKLKSLKINKIMINREAGFEIQLFYSDCRSSIGEICGNNNFSSNKLRFHERKGALVKLSNNHR
jgi:hypothetical protein